MLPAEFGPFRKLVLAARGVELLPQREVLLLHLFRRGGLLRRLRRKRDIYCPELHGDHGVSSCMESRARPRSGR